MTKWEYMTTNSWNEVKKLGREGWELAGISYNPEAFHRNTFYLKRPKQTKKKFAESGEVRKLKEQLKSLTRDYDGYWSNR